MSDVGKLHLDSTSKKIKLVKKTRTLNAIMVVYDQTPLAKPAEHDPKTIYKSLERVSTTCAI